MLAEVWVNVIVSFDGVVVVTNWVTTTCDPVVVSAGKTTWVVVKVIVEMAVPVSVVDEFDGAAASVLVLFTWAKPGATSARASRILFSFILCFSKNCTDELLRCIALFLR